MVSAGQYGHLKLREVARAILCTAFRDSTWPQGSIIAGLPWSVCSRETGHAKMVWKMKSGPSSIGTGSCSLPLMSCRTQSCQLLQKSHRAGCCGRATPENGWPSRLPA